MKRGKKIPRVLEESEFRKLLSYAKKNMVYRDYGIIKMLLYFGMRNSELTNLKIEDIKIDEEFLYVREGKGKKDRQIPFLDLDFDSEPIKRTILRLIGNRNSGYLIRGKMENKPISDRQIRNIVKEACRNAGIKNYEDIHPHTFRHTFNTYLQSIGVSRETRQKLLGHEKVDTTDLYSWDNTYAKTEINKRIKFMKLIKDKEFLEKERKLNEMEKNAVTIEKKLEILNERIKMNNKMLSILMGL